MKTNFEGTLKMGKPISVQLYSLREAASKDFKGVLEKVAKMGYKGVEPAGLHGLKPAEFKKICDDLGLKISSSHGPWIRSLDNVAEGVDVAGIFGLDMLCTGFGQNEFKDMDSIKKTAELVNSFVAELAKHGLKLFIHNHWWEFCKVDGQIAYDHFAKLCPDVLFEIDAYWSSNFQANDPAEQLKKFAKRTPYLHIKDGPLEKDKAMMALGTGKMDIPKLLKSADPKVLRWIIVELDRCDTDMVEAIEKSYKYMISNGLAEGNKPA